MGNASGKEDEFSSVQNTLNESKAKLTPNGKPSEQNLKDIFERNQNPRFSKSSIKQTIIKGISEKDQTNKIDALKSLTKSISPNKKESISSSPLEKLMTSRFSANNQSSSTKSLKANTVFLSKLGMAIVKKYSSKLTLNDINTQLLRHVFKKDIKGMKQEIKNLVDNLDEKQFQYEMTVAFWLSIHLEFLDVSNYLVRKIPMLKKIVASSLKKKQENMLVTQGLSRKNTEKRKSKFEQDNPLEAGYNEEDDENFTGLIINKHLIKEDEDETYHNTPDKLLTTGQNPFRSKFSLSKQKTNKNMNESDSLSNLVPTEFKVNTEVAESLFNYFENVAQLIELKEILRNEFPTLMTNILRIILNKQEEKLSQIIIAYYKCQILEEILNKAIETNQFDFLQYMYAFQKNFLYDKVERISLQITFTMLFKFIRVLKPNNEEFKELIKDVCDWRIPQSQDNLLLALLVFQQDDLALQYMGNNGNNLNENLLLYCLDTQNTKFLLSALKLRAFDKLIFREDSVVGKLLGYLNEGTRANYILGLMQFIDISIWKNRKLKELLEILCSFAEQNYENNKLLLSYNPIMTICLSCETLKNIAIFRKKFENECKRISSQLLRLGEMYLSKIQDESYYEKVMLDADSKERSVLKIITSNNFEQLMDEKDPKAENLMNKIWKGKEAANCDGNIFGYSSLSNVVFKSFSRLNANAQNNGLVALASNSFEPNFKVDYLIQHRYRSRSIAFYFQKEFFSALLMLILILVHIQQWISFQDYIEIYNDNYAHYQDHDDDLSDEKTKLNNDLVDAQSDGSLISSLGIFTYMFAFAIVFHLILKIVYNILAKEKILLDRWTVMDVINALVNIVAVQIIRRVSIDNLTNPTMKDIMDYFMIIVLTASWLRFFMYFLVIRTISKLLLTLIEMVEDTLSFIFIVSCYIVIMTSIFTTFYQDVNPEKFGSLTTTIRTLFDAMMSVYNYDNMGGRELSYSILIVFHVFFSNVLLLNYLIAILSTTYDNMKHSGIFKYKKNLFYYCERYVIAFNDEQYGQLILHPPPLCYLCVVFLPFLGKKEKIQQLQKFVSQTMFWIENSFIIVAFFFYEILLVPFAFLKTALNLFHVLNAGSIRKMCVLVQWLTMGIFIDIYLIFCDLRNLLKIISQNNGFQGQGSGQLQDDQLNIKIQIEILNLARDSVIKLFKALRDHFKGENEEKEQFKKKGKKDKIKNNMSSKQSRSDNQSSYISQSNTGIKPKQNRKSREINEEELKIKDDGDGSSTSSYDLSENEDSDIENFNIYEQLEALEMQAGYNPNDSNCLYVVKKSVILYDLIIKLKTYWRTRRQQQMSDKQKKKTLKKNETFKDDLFKEKRHFSLFVQNEEQKLVEMNSFMQEEDEDNNEDIDKGTENRQSKKYFSRRKSKIVFLDHFLNDQHLKAKATLKNSFGLTLGDQQIRSPTSKSSKSHFDRALTQKKDDNNDYLDLDLSPLELKCITQFFTNFVVVSETSLQEHIDIVLFLRALPDRITPENINKVKLFNFKLCQESLIAYQNLDLVNAFEYFDDKNRERVQQVKEKLSDQRSSLSEIREIVKFIKRKMYNRDRRPMMDEERKQSDNSPIKNRQKSGLLSPRTHGSQTNRFQSIGNPMISNQLSQTAMKYNLLGVNHQNPQNPTQKYLFLSNQQNGKNQFGQSQQEQTQPSQKKNTIESTYQYEFN